MNKKSLRTTSSSRIRQLILLLVCLPSTTQAQKMSPAGTLMSLPVGLTLPIQINHGFRAGSSKPGTAIVGVTTQRISISEYLYLKPGAKVMGTIVVSRAADNRTQQPAILTIRFTALSYRKQIIPIAVRAIAIANFTDVGETAVPANGSTDRGNASPASWTTHQIGDDELCRSGWIGEVVDATSNRVGFADYFGVYADPPPRASGTAAIPHAIGVFSTNVKGLYGFDNGAALHASGGNITVTSPHKLILRNGDNLLLEVLPPSTDVSSSQMQSRGAASA
jgi:hypothetical protein